MCTKINLQFDQNEKEMQFFIYVFTKVKDTEVMSSNDLTEYAG